MASNHIEKHVFFNMAPINQLQSHLKSPDMFFRCPGHLFWTCAGSPLVGALPQAETASLCSSLFFKRCFLICLLACFGFPASSRYQSWNQTPEELCRFHPISPQNPRPVSRAWKMQNKQFSLPAVSRGRFSVMFFFGLKSECSL